jgi:two-component system, OmpR family, phosphate regulon sensor histidine kinase PhoR
MNGKTIDVRTTKRGTEEILISISDQGVGISKLDQAKLFQKFSRLENPLSIEVGGNGLGLYWSKKIITLHGGDITVSSRPGKGSKFTVVLPSVHS